MSSYRLTWWPTSTSWSVSADRSAFLTEAARDEIQRRKQRNALRAVKGAWKDEDHPELKHGSAAWVRQMRSESEKRFEQIEQHWDRS